VWTRLKKTSIADSPPSFSSTGLNNERCPWPAGRAVGGASVINNNIYTRGNPNDFDRWLEAGNVGWGYKDVLPYFKKSEDIDVPELKRSEYHGVGGYLNVDYSPYKSKLMDAFLESAPEVGLNLTDYNSPDGNVGFSRIQGTIQFGEIFFFLFKTSVLPPFLIRSNETTATLDSCVLCSSMPIP
jgi:Choline dehydrogenase and related flavoproteins